MALKLPDQLLIYLDEARNAYKQAIKEIEFSGSTYQILVEDPNSKKEFWAFLQLDDQGLIKDSFCSCEDIESSSGCLHSAIAYLSLFDQYDKPLHVRFKASLWNQLCRIYADFFHQNQLTPVLDEKKGRYEYQSQSGRILFYIESKTKKGQEWIRTLFRKKDLESEETSLKFSNLSAEELELWRQGQPSLDFAYELSPWSDLAKYLTQLQDKKPYKIRFEYSERDLPNRIYIDFDDFNLFFYISEANLKKIIPALSTVKSPLTILDDKQQSNWEIIYNEVKRGLTIKKIRKESSKQEEETSISVHGWSYIKGKGFIGEESSFLMDNQTISEKELPQVLTEYGHLIATYLKNTKIHPHIHPLRYHLSFDPKWHFHIETYLFEPGDLVQEPSHLFGDWAYLHNRGFYQVKGNYFEEKFIEIPPQSVSEFVTKNRVWLQKQSGFQIHINNIEYDLKYEITEHNRLIFKRNTDLDIKESIQDFGTWVYLEGSGFYPKKMTAFRATLRPGLSVSQEQIPLFIQMNKNELGLIPGFFTQICPIESVNIKIELDNKEKILISPIFQLHSSYSEDQCIFFDDYVYIKENGFFELPAKMRIPEPYNHKNLIGKKERDDFILEELPLLKKHGAHIDHRLVEPKRIELIIDQIQINKELGRGWYQFHLYYQTEEGIIPFDEIYEAMQTKHQFAFFEAGMIDLYSSRFDWIKHLGKNRFNEKEKTLTLSSLDFMRLNAWDALTFKEHATAVSNNSKQLFNQLTTLTTPDEPDIGGLVSHLRPYQKLGVHWLWFLYQQQLSGLLCDDMGLGKTHQGMALIASIRNFIHKHAEGIPCHILIVCPTSVIYHWQEKLAQYMPQIKVSTFFGTKRSLEKFQKEYDILLTSYGILRNEKETLSKIEFELAIFDELQVAKNQTSQIYSALKTVKARMRLGMTGTPVENRLRELKSLFDIVLPTYLPNEKNYRDNFIKPIEKQNSEEKKNLLKRIVHPFILRRKKEEVLKDLPEKIEEVSHCDLSDVQAQLYSEVLAQRRHHLIEELRHSDHVPYMHIFALLSSLKQICDHPAVYLKTPQDYQKYPSGKWDLFTELLAEARESGQKVVIFSQYLFMLDIFEAYLKEHNILYASIRGATQNRKEQLQMFQHNPQCEVFVGSLQATGLGIDLTAASVVIHYDRWWNAARERQATDRVHRIGQKRGVQVFKLVTKGTFEERIDEMIQRKGRLMEEVIGVDEENTLKKYSREELIALLQDPSGA